MRYIGGMLVIAWCLVLISGCLETDDPAFHPADEDAVDGDSDEVDDTDGDLPDGDQSDGDVPDGDDDFPALDLNWLQIPGGTFEMGCTGNAEGCIMREFPIHTVDIMSFKMMKYEVTQQQFLQVMGVNPSAFQPPEHDECMDCPVERVDWDQAKTFCERVGGRLPSEAEWEYAARAGTTTMYYCGSAPTCLDRIAWYKDNSSDRTHQVGEKDANAFGFHDMIGNVKEWVEDYYHEDYTGAPTDGSAWIVDPFVSMHVTRGGFYRMLPYFELRVSNRKIPLNMTGIDPYVSQGFRCAQDDPSPIDGDVTDGDQTDGDQTDGDDDSPSLNLNWLQIPGGTFEMGCIGNPDGCYQWEFPVHPVNITGFKMMKYEVTQQQFLQVMGMNPSVFQPPEHEECMDCPVESVDWDQAKAFCESIGARLPSEAEWEYAARAGSTAAYYCEGISPFCLNRIAWYSHNSCDRTHPVGEMGANAFGLHDTLGNAKEWVEDFWHADYMGAPADGSAWIEDTQSSVHVMRGGSFRMIYFELRLSLREFPFYLPGMSEKFPTGFRCAQDDPLPIDGDWDWDTDLADGDVTDGDEEPLPTIWTDPDTGLTWQNVIERHSYKWDEAIQYCEEMAFAGYDDWRLPTISELRSLVRGCPNTETGGICGITDSCLDMSCDVDRDCDNCSSSCGPSDGCYWPEALGSDCQSHISSSLVVGCDESCVWTVNFGGGGVDFLPMVFGDKVRCVRND